MALWAITDFLPHHFAKWFVGIGAQDAKKLQHGQMRQLLVVEAMPPDVFVDREIDAFDDLPHAPTLTVTGRENP